MNRRARPRGPLLRRLGTAFALGLGAMLFGAGCGGGGGGGGVAPPTGPTGGTSFTADSAAGSNSVFLAAGGAATGTTFRLEVRTSNVRDFYGVAFDLLYPSSIMSLSGSGTEGTFLNSGAPTTFNVVEDPPGNIVVGISRLGSVGGASGSGLLLSLDFNVTASGQGEFRLLNPGAVGAGGTAKPNVDFIAGTVQTVR